MNYKNVLLLIGSLFIILVLAACGSSSANEESESWLEGAKLDEEETIDELYEKAKDEGELTVYAQSSATENVISSFEEEYPDVNVLITKVSSTDMLERVKLENEGNVEGADVVFGKDTNGFWKNELVDNGILHNYQPDVLTTNLLEPYNSYPGLPVITEVITVLYNSDANAEPPIDSWWDLTRPEWKGNINMKNPLEAADIQDLFLTMIKYSDEMEEAYKQEFGEEIELNETENAGYEFIKRFLDNDVVLMSSMGDSIDAVSQSTSDVPPIAIGSTVKLRDVVNIDAPLAMVEELEPRVSVPGTSKAFIVDQSPNVNAAKLFIRWLSGEEDGQGEGFMPFNNPGTFSTREDIIQDFQDLGVPKLDELDLWEEDVDFYYENAGELRDFLISIL